ncbi:MAG: preprotein translocase subunit SecA [Patescibacteria group bacterium]
MSKFLNIIFGDPSKKVLADLRKEVEIINGLESSLLNLSDDDLKAKTVEFKEKLKNGVKLDDLAHEVFAVVREVAKRQLGQRHYDVQLMGGLMLHRRAIAEMRTGEGKTLTSTLPLYLNALEGKGCHLVTVNDYLAKRDCVWMGQVYYALGMSVGCIAHESGYVYDPEYKGNEESLGELKGAEESDEERDKERDATGSFKVQTDYLRPVERNEAYNADITYGTNNEFGFDYLRDNMAPTLDKCVMRDLHYAIVDEVDSILIDEARTPLIISAPAEESNQLYYRFAQIVSALKVDVDYNIDEKMRQANFTEEGIQKIERALNIDNLYTVENVGLQHFADTALRAKALFENDVHYVVKEGEVIIVDEFTGRLMQGRRFSEGIHQSIEAKKNVQIQRESLTLATITFQNFFRMYRKIAGMTGTAATESEEFGKIYGLDVLVIPTNLPNKRIDKIDRVYKTEKAKWNAVVEEIKLRHETGQPVLVGTVSIDKNELLGSLLSKTGVPFQLLNAKNHMTEGEIIAQAGRHGAVTIATNMAGRGVDIMLGGNPPDKEAQKKVIEAGGLHVIGTGRHESRRIDNQLRGRSGRQGDIGSTQFFVSLQDDLLRVFIPESMSKMMDRLGLPDDMPIENKMVANSIEKAQTRVEGNNFDTRKHLLEYDDVLNKHRVAIYERRREILDSFSNNKSELKSRILELIEDEVEQVVMFHTGEAVEGVNAKPDIDTKEISEVIGTIVELTGEQARELKTLWGDGSNYDKDKVAAARVRTGIIEKTMEFVHAKYSAIESQFNVPPLPEGGLGGVGVLHDVERSVITRAIDTLWIDHLAAMTALRTGIGLQGYGQKDPLVEYKKESYHMFQNLLASINGEIVYSFYKYAEHAARMQAPQEEKSVFEKAGIKFLGAKKTAGDDGSNSPPLQEGAGGGLALNQAIKSDKVGRNEPCSCGSGTKYKKCCGK